MKWSYLYSVFRQWLPRNKLEPLGVDSGLDKAKLLENRKPNVRKAVQRAYEKAILHRCSVTGEPNPLSGDSEIDENEWIMKSCFTFFYNIVDLFVNWTSLLSSCQKWIWANYFSIYLYINILKLLNFQNKNKNMTKQIKIFEWIGHNSRHAFIKRSTDVNWMA